MDDIEQKLIHGLILWLIAIFGLAFLNRRKFIVGLTYIWFGDLAINHLFGGMIYLVPGYSPQDPMLRGFTPDNTAEGFWITSLGLVGFLAGAMVTGPLMAAALRVDRKSSQKKLSPRLPLQLLSCGFFFYFILKFLQNIPSLGTLSQSGWMLVQVGICLAARNAYLLNNQKAFGLWLVVGLIFFPTFTLVFQGFLGFGIKVMLIILCFTSVYYRDKWKIFILTPIILWLGISLFVNYMNAKESIRESVWSGAGLKDRMASTQKIFAEPQGFSIHNVQHLDLINARLNQNCLVGVAADYLKSGQTEFAHGKTIWEAVLAVIPRIVWKNKPIIGGSGSLVTDYTGITFAEGTSVGVGLPLELYANFGMAGVVGGFFIVGILLSFYDRVAGKALLCEDVKTFLFFFLPGLAFTTTIGSLMEATSSFAAMYVFLFLINRFVFKRHRRLSKLTSADNAPLKKLQRL